DNHRLPVWRGRHLDCDDLLRADVIQQLMCLGRIDIAEIERRHGVDFIAYFREEIDRLSDLVEDGLVKLGDRSIYATSRGRLLLRIIAMCFDRYLHEALPDAAPRYSQAI